jgi:DNA repair photolyase
MSAPDRLVKRRGSRLKPSSHSPGPDPGLDSEDLERDDHYLLRRDAPPVQYLPDHSSEIVTEDASPELGTRYSLNPYRGCLHGCKYCDARVSHLVLGLDAGQDFETKVLVQEESAELFREFLARKSWNAEPIAMSALTDCYQPAERDYRLARACLKVALELRQPLSIMTKNALVLRDRDVLREMARLGLVHLNVSIATLDPDLARSMEPRTSPPAERLRTIRRLTGAGIPVRVLLAPIIPGLNETEIPALLAAAKQAGARAAGYSLVRLPAAVERVFKEWLEQTQPGRLRRIEGRLQGALEGPSQAPEAGSGSAELLSSEVVRSIAEMFRVFANRSRLDGSLAPLDGSQFRRPKAKTGQLLLF